ncbi:MAG TPA: hypothetical protein IAA00_02240, partial [Candidatus Blautia ornithocaccae]|nr:hypothetical protein [Candidatus Blautia ornithocaccae]
YYVIGGASLKAVVTNYTYLTGRVPMPQKWTLGYQQSRWGYSVSQKQVEKIAENLRKYDLPCDVLHLDIDYMKGYRVFTWRKDTYEAQIKQIKLVGENHPNLKLDDWLSLNGVTWETLTREQAGAMLNALKQKYGDE